MKKILFITIAMILILAGCGAADKMPQEGIAVPPVPEPTGYMDTVSDGSDGRQMPEAFTLGNDTFGFDAAALLYSSQGNLALSPASLELALLMAQAGAVGETAQQMKAALSVGELGDEELLGVCMQVMKRANTGGMEAANSIWIDERLPLSPDYKDICTKYFLSDAFTVDLASEKTMRQINDWASDKTHGRIDQMHDEPLRSDTMLVLINALYFLGDWAMPFEADDTHEESFAAPSGDIKVQMMNSTRETAYYDGQDFDMISLDFTSESGDGGFAMALLLPEADGSIIGLLDDMDGDAFAGALAGMYSETVKVKLPKFEYKFGTSFVDTLKALGMQDAFTGAATFDVMTGGNNDLFISEVLHKCYIRVDELGAEAAAVTEVQMAKGMSPVEDFPKFYANRPFVFLIYGKTDGMIYFLGAVNNPLLHE